MVFVLFLFHFAVGMMQQWHRCDVEFVELKFEAVFFLGILQEVIDQFRPIGDVIEHEHMVVRVVTVSLLSEGVFAADGLAHFAEDKGQAVRTPNKSQIQTLLRVLLHDNFTEPGFKVLSRLEALQGCLHDFFVRVQGQVLPKDKRR